MPRRLLTAKFVESVKPPTTGQVDYFDTLERGLVLRLGSTGKKTWCYLYRMPGSRRMRRLTIDEVLSLKEARGRAASYRVKVKNDREDPAAEHAEWKRVDTFEELATWYLRLNAQKKSHSEERRIINTELLPQWRDRKATEITRADVRALLRGIADRPAPVMANRTHKLVRRVYNAAIDEEVRGITMNPAARMKPPGGAEQSRDRVLTTAEIRRLWNVLVVAQEPGRAPDCDPESVPPVSATMARGLQLVLLTGQRPGEVFEMKWEELSQNRQWWDIPRTLTKNGNPHRVPLTKTARTILKAAETDAPDDAVYVFAGSAFTSVAARAKKCAATLSAWKPLGFAFHRHDLRRTCASRMGEAGVSQEIIARVLNHSVAGPRVTQTYNRFAYDAEKRAALERWEKRLLGLLKEKNDGSKVTRIRRSA